MKAATRVMLTGGTGFIGTRLVNGLVAAGHTVSIVTRSPENYRSAGSGVEYAGWLPDVERHHAIVHLAGEPLIGRRWTAGVKRAIRESRVDSTRRLVEALRQAKRRPAVLVCGSAIGFYGDRGDETLTESSSVGDDFLAEVCQAWEAEALAAEELGVRVVRVRTGVVLGGSGGALQQMLLPFRLGLGGKIGSGAQWFSWVHLKDMVGLLLRAVDDPNLRGAFNGTAPNPVTNKEFTATLGRVLHRPTILPLPPFVLRLRFGEAAEVLTASQRCLPEAALKAGYAFHFPTLEGALRDILD